MSLPIKIHHSLKKCDYTLFLELSKLSNSKLVKSQETMVPTKKGHVSWPWRIDCGICHNLPGVMLRYDGELSGRIRAFRRSTYIISSFLTSNLNNIYAYIYVIMNHYRNLIDVKLLLFSLTDSFNSVC